MAALNTLRTKGTWIMTGAIAFALLAFLLSDGNFLNQNPNTSVGSINGNDVSLKTFSENIDDLTFFNSFISGDNNLSSEDVAQIEIQAWQRLVMQDIFDNSTKNLGLEIGNDELVDMAYGKYISPILLSFFGNELGQLDKQAFTGFLGGIEYDPSGNGIRFWNMTEEQMVAEREMSKFTTLVRNGQYVTDFEIESGIEASKFSYDMQYVTNVANLDYNVEVSDAKLKKYYESNLSSFKADRFREIEYVVFNATPSTDDYTDAKVEFNEMLDEFKITDNLSQFIGLNSEEKFDNRYYSKNNINPTFFEFAFGEKQDPLYISDMTANSYIAARVSDKRVMPDSVTLRVVAVPVSLNTDSLVNVIKAGGFDKVVENNGLGGAERAVEQVLSMSDMQDDILFDVKKGDVKVLPANEGVVGLAYIVKVGKKQEMVQLAKLVYNVTPSNRTEQDNYAAANVFADKVYAAQNDFEKIVSEDAMSKRVARLIPSDREVNSVKDTKELIRWAFNATKGDVSNVMTSGSSNYIVYLKESFDGGQVSFEAVKDDVKNSYLLNEFTVNGKSEMAKFASLEDAAKELNTDVKVVEGVTFASFMIPGLGMSPELLGAMIVTANDKLSSPVTISGTAGLFKVIAKKPANERTSAIEKTMIQSLNAANLDNRFLMSLMSASNVVDNRVIYF